MYESKKQAEKFREYNEWLTKQYWEIQAGVSILCGAPEYIHSGNFNPTLVPKRGKGGFDDIEFWVRFHTFFKVILEAVESQQIDFYGMPQHVQSLSEYLSSSLSKHLPLLQESKIQSRLVNAHQMIAAVIAKGFDLPDELQTAANICISKASRVEGKIAENHVMADAIIHFQWWKEPDSTMEEVNEELKKIVKSHRNLWVYKQKESGNRLINPCCG